MIERHQDYQITIASVPVGGVVKVPLKLDTDAPFALRLVRSRNIGLNGWRFEDPQGKYQSTQLRTDWITPVSPGVGPFPSRGSIIYPEMIYPPGATIQIDIGNTGEGPITNATLLFRGSKLFTGDTQWAPTYPPVMGILPSIYQVIVPQVGLTEMRLNQSLVIKNNADFVYRAGVCDEFTVAVSGGPTPTPSQFQFTNLFVQLRDEQQKAYSNQPIHVNDLFGQGLPTPFGSGSNDDQVLFTPGLITPEIYIPRRHSLYFDVIRNDVSGVPVDLYFRFIGMGVFER